MMNMNTEDTQFLYFRKNCEGKKCKCIFIIIYLHYCFPLLIAFTWIQNVIWFVLIRFVSIWFDLIYVHSCTDSNMLNVFLSFSSCSSSSSFPRSFFNMYALLSQQYQHLVYCMKQQHNSDFFTILFFSGRAFMAVI